jgi:hypothetical protein
MDPFWLSGTAALLVLSFVVVFLLLFLVKEVEGNLRISTAAEKPHYMHDDWSGHHLLPMKNHHR